MLWLANILHLATREGTIVLISQSALRVNLDDERVAAMWSTHAEGNYLPITGGSAAVTSSRLRSG